MYIQQSRVMQGLPSLTDTEIYILNLLSESPGSYGLQMVKGSDGYLKSRSVYVYLHRMQKKGYVYSEKEDSGPGETGPPRRKYFISGLGVRALDAWRLFVAQKSGSQFGTAS